MSLVTGRFERVESFKTEKMRSACYNMFVDGKKYSLGWKNVAGSVPNGATIEFSYENVKGYDTVQGEIKILNAPAPGTQAAVSAPATQSGSSPQSNYAALDRAIARVNGWLNQPNGPKRQINLAQLMKYDAAVADHYKAYGQTGVIEPLSAEELAKLKEIIQAPAEGVPAEERMA